MPLLLSSGADTGFQYLQSKLRDIVVGVMEGFNYHPQKLKLQPGDALFLYTDGITEAFNVNKEMYGEEQLRSFLDANKTMPLKTLLPAVYNDIKAFAGSAEQSDDITMLMFRLW
jgi:sigma-B regulation protein RsbU (phosphoserine phosphatase)